MIIQRRSRAAHVPSDSLLRRWARGALKRPAEVTLRIVAATEARRLNREFRGKDYPTNVLTFIYGDKPLSGTSSCARRWWRARRASRARR